ncbi:hypothetical protein [Pedobacter gandavensis]|uniref:hypothetical protein n=1 Tax=Pedobacter gandavensis TaxID=2679963 RepID=UPI00292E7E78|nr:hypothetical protein [Pedobacter gandavensis]
MKSNVSVLITLKELRTSLLQDLKKLDKAIEELEPKTLAEIDKIANEGTIGIHQFKKMKSDDEKIIFAIQNLGKAGIEAIIKYLVILGEEREVKKLTAIVKASLLNLIGLRLVEEEIKNRKSEYKIKRK